ncbi:MAG: PHP domain-containing protein [Nitrospirae bacterium]|nr:PHP domain-containing protein [Nitrospirota bacterium]
MLTRGRAIAIGLILALVMGVACTPRVRFLALRQELAALTIAPDAPPLDGLRRYRGVIHVHSNLSHDSRGDPAEILSAAKAIGLDFVMMTDHNNPKIFQRGLEGLHDGVLIVRGAEIGSEGDYLLALGIESFIDPAGKTFREITAAIAAQGGVAIGAHPNRFHHWSDPGLAGVEVWDLYDEAISDRWRYATLALDVLFSYGAYPAEILLSIVRHPARALAAFDDETRRRPLVAIGTPDAHRNVRIFRRLDPYPLTLHLVTTYLLAEDKTRPALLDALRRGRAYLAFDLLASAPTFDFRLVDGQGKSWMMGDRVPAGAGRTLRVFAPHAGRITVIRDGRVISQTDAPTLEQPVDGPGVYRAEVALSVQGQWRPWIYSNPIYVQ